MRSVLAVLVVLLPATGHGEPEVIDRASHEVDVYPTASYETGFGVGGGASLGDSDLFGAGERLELDASAGGQYAWRAGLKLHSGRRVPVVSFELDASYEQRPDAPFYGIGNDADEEMRFRDDLVRTVARVNIPFMRELGDTLKTRFALAHTRRELMGDTFANLRFEGELVLDTRRPSSSLATETRDVSGLYASLYAGASSDLATDQYWFSYYGAELQSYFDLYRSKHVLALRFIVDTIEEGTPRFVDLPQLGGTELLRGYPQGRFRDRAMMLATAEYTWDFGDRLAAYTFVDAGRVWPSLGDITLDEPRVGYGIGLQVRTARRYFGRVQAAASRDGDFVLEVVFSPAFARRERTRY